MLGHARTTSVHYRTACPRLRRAQRSGPCAGDARKRRSSGGRQGCACQNRDVSPAETSRRPTALAIFLVVAGLIGLWAAFELTLDKFAVLENPDTNLSCNFSVLVQCGKNLGSWQGSVLGFPNPVLGLGGWTATVAMGAGILAGGIFRRWFWLLFNLGVVGALVLVIFLIYSSIYVLNTLCPWCMLTWIVTIPTFWAVSLFNLKSGNIPLPERARSFFATVYGWVPIITLVSYLVIALLAQLRLDWIHQLFL